MGRAGVTIEVTEKDTGWKDLFELVQELKRAGTHVKVGVLEGTVKGDERRETGGVRSAQTGIGGIGMGGRIGTGGVAKPGLTNAELAAIHEFGSSDGHVPERSFIRTTFNANKARYLDMLKMLLTRVIERKIDVETAFSIVGMKLATDIKNYVTKGAGVPPPNAPSTLARKIAKGAWTRRGLLKTGFSPRTLIDTGRMLGAITHAVFRGAIKGE